MRAVVCGAGAAGSIVATRLSEDPDVEVVLVEVGPHYRAGAVHVPRGRVVGGSSVTNGAIALRGHPEAAATGTVRLPSADRT